MSRETSRVDLAIRVAKPNLGAPRRATRVARRCWRVWRAAAACLGLTMMAATAGAQDRGPVLLLQPGMLSADFVSAPDGYPATSGFNLRFSTLVPTSSKWVTLVVGASVTPYGTSGITPRNANTPMLFVGNVFPLLPKQKTGGWFDVQLPLYLTYAYGGGGPNNTDLYGRDVMLEAAAQFYVGQKVLRDLGPAFSRLRVYAMMNQVVTPNADVNTGKTDRFNPIALYGITLPIGGRTTER